MNRSSLFDEMAIIIPISPNETEWSLLLSDLKKIKGQPEIILSGPKKPKDASQQNWCDSPAGRAIQMNQAAKHTNKKFLWFLHADSRVSEKVFIDLEKGLENNPNALFYFALRFFNGPLLIKLNEWGCWFRSNILKVPFGDQGFCLSKINFDSVNGFTENTDFGEDHLFLWKLRQNNVKLKFLKSALKTSARKYTKNGWARVTWQHFHLWTRQAWPEWRKLRNK